MASDKGQLNNTFQHSIGRHDNTLFKRPYRNKVAKAEYLPQSVSFIDLEVLETLKTYRKDIAKTSQFETIEYIEVETGRPVVLDIADTLGRGVVFMSVHTFKLAYLIVAGVFSVVWTLTRTSRQPSRQRQDKRQDINVNVTVNIKN